MKDKPARPTFPHANPPVDLGRTPLTTAFPLVVSLRMDVPTPPPKRPGGEANGSTRPTRPPLGR